MGFHHVFGSAYKGKLILIRSKKERLICGMRRFLSLTHTNLFLDESVVLEDGH